MIYMANMDRKNYMVVKQICCGQDTQWASRMAGCEDSAHTSAARAAWAAECFGSYCPAFVSQKLVFSDNLDGIVRLTTGLKPFVPQAEAIIYMGNNDNYISDHNGVNMLVDARGPGRDQARFNLITHNLEGLCYRAESRKRARYEYVMAHLTEYFGQHIAPGTVMMVQEMALQLEKKNIQKQREILTKNTGDVLDRLTPLNGNLVARDDGYTGAIIYDASVWNLIQELNISRKGSNKYSNAYLMQFREYPGLHLWFTNIHLKAFGGGITTQTQMNTAHAEELANIIGHILENNPEHYPIYFAGDFNNGAVKETLIISALQKVYEGPIYNKVLVDDIQTIDHQQFQQLYEPPPVIEQRPQDMESALAQALENL